MSGFQLVDRAKIIERESKDSSFKFALLRRTIDIIQNYPHYKLAKEDGKIYYPMGLMVLKWIDYYYPFLQYEIMIYGTFFPATVGLTSKKVMQFLLRSFYQINR